MTDIERFIAKVKKTNKCWQWSASCFKSNGRPRFSFQGKAWVAARVAYTLFIGPIPKGLYVCHTCDNKKCVNPEHLFVATHAENMRDMVKKNRQARGERSGGAKLKAKQVERIRARYAKGGITQRALANEYGVKLLTIWCLLKNHTWK